MSRFPRSRKKDGRTGLEPGTAPTSIAHLTEDFQRKMPENRAFLAFQPSDLTLRCRTVDGQTSVLNAVGQAFTAWNGGNCAESRISDPRRRQLDYFLYQLRISSPRLAGGHRELRP